MRVSKQNQWMLLCLVFVMILVRPGWTAQLPAKAEKALPDQKWEEVRTALTADDSRSTDPVARLLVAHAGLATNRNNEALSLFASPREDADFSKWAEWTASLLRAHPDSAVAYYLRGDALARQGKLETAVTEFSASLAKDGGFALALVARGTVQAMLGKIDEPVVNLMQATMEAPNLAEAHAALGNYYVVRSEGAKGALEFYNKAIEINPEFALAYNGIGCAYFGDGKFEEATQAFNMASHLNPALVVAEINQGFASAYASKLVALGNMEKRPGTTLEFHQQQQEILKEQNQKLLNMLPTQKDQEFWGKMDALTWILQSDEKTQALVKEYGLQKVQMGAFLKMQEFKSQIAETSQKVQTLHGTISSYDQTIGKLRAAEAITSLGFSAYGAAKDLQKGWEIAGLKTEMRAEKSALSSIAPNNALKTVIDAIPLGLNPVALGGSIASSGFKTARSVLNDKRDAAEVEFDHLVSQVPVLPAQLRAMETNLFRLGGTFTPQAPIRSSSQVPGYYTSVDRPLTELGALASMVDKGIKPPDGLTRSALIVAQDPFRTNILQSELNRYGFQTKVVSPGTDVQAEAKRWGADVILGIRGTPEMKVPQIEKVPQMGRITRDDDLGKLPPPPPYRRGSAGIGIPDVDMGKKLPPPFPPDKGGGAAGIPQMAQPPIQQKWDWGKQFTPVYPRGAPGGVSTEEIAKSFVDKGNWPVMTSFSLFYKAGSSAEVQDGEGDR